MKTKNAIQEKSFAFALRIIFLSRHLEQKRETILSKQVLRSGTSIGANVEEAIGGLTRKEFTQRLGTAYKEARETIFWLKILRNTGALEEKLSLSLISDCDELVRMLGSAQKTLQTKQSSVKETNKGKNSATISDSLS
jgi:four helix bundle protein